MTHAQRLVLLARLDPSSGRDLCRQALEEGNWVLQTQALLTLAQVAPQEAERSALHVLKGKPVNQVRGAALETLGTSKKAAVLGLLLEGLDGSEAVCRGAAEGLKKSPQPKVAARLLKEAPDTKRIPIIALSAHTMPGDRERALAAGCDEYDAKPIDFERLLAKIGCLLQNRIPP